MIQCTNLIKVKFSSFLPVQVKVVFKTSQSNPHSRMLMTFLPLTHSQLPNIYLPHSPSITEYLISSLSLTLIEYLISSPSITEYLITSPSITEYLISSPSITECLSTSLSLTLKKGPERYLHYYSLAFGSAIAHFIRLSWCACFC